MKDVLICCTDAEGSQLEWLAKALFDSGWSVDFMHKGSSGVASAHCVIAVWSPNSVGDAWLTARAKTASKRRRLVSIRLGGARPPRGLRSEQVIDLSEWPARGADRAINTLLGSVDAVANGVSLRGGDGGRSKLWVALAACALLIGGGYVLFRLAQEPSAAGGGERQAESYAASAHAADAAAVAEHAMRNAVTTDRPSGAEGDRVIDSGDAPVKPAVMTSDAARVGAQSLARLAAVIDGGDASLDDIRGAAEEALALDPQEPHARATLAVLRGLVDLQWADAQTYLRDLDAASSDAALASIVERFRALFEERANPVADGTVADPLCGIADDAAFAQAIVDLDGAGRLTLLKRGCVVERIQRSPEARRRIGIVRG